MYRVKWCKVYILIKYYQFYRYPLVYLLLYIEKLANSVNDVWKKPDKDIKIENNSSNLVENMINKNT